jgi:uncharacterized protein
MNRDRTFVEKTAAFIKNKFQGESSGHDWWHTYRVWQNALSIAVTEPAANLLVVELAALLHDVADWKFNHGDETEGPRQARVWLEQNGSASEVSDQVCAIISGVTFKGAGVATPMESIEGKIVQDADRLDAIGAIGIARAFAYGGYHGQVLYDPEQKPERHTSFSAYKNNTGPSINHFYEKLLLLKERMQTPAGQEMAAERHAFMLTYLKQFYQEWEGGSGKQTGA